MTSVEELSAPYASFMLGPRPGPEVCSRCFDLIGGTAGCYPCAHYGGWVDAASPISYSVAGGQLHRALRNYKRLAGPAAESCIVGLAAVVSRHLALHERCLARAAGVGGFEVVTIVPSSGSARGERHPLDQLVGERVGPVRGRYERLLRRTGAAATPHHFNIHKYEAVREVADRSVLLIDDTWTTGANVQSAAVVLKGAGARRVAALVIGRYVNRGWGDNDHHLQGMPAFDWDACAWCRRTDGAAGRR